MQDQLSSEWKDGLSQSDRLLQMLLPGSIAIDGRNPAALMLRAARLAAQFNFYNSENAIEGDWQEFFLSDFNILTLMSSALDLSPHIDAYESRLSEIRLAADATSLQQGRRELTGVITGLADALTFLLQKAMAISLPPDIAAKLAEILDAVASIRRTIEDPQPTAGESSPPTAGKSSPPAAAGDTSSLYAAFPNLLIQYNRIQDVYNYHRQGKDWTTAQYTPHLAMLVAFVHLYGYVSAQINGLTKVHLDFYYRQILELTSRPEVPDKVHLLFTPEANASHIRLPRGEEMLAEIPGRDEPLKYRLTTDITVTKTKVAALRTLFTSNRPIFMDDTPEHRLIRNTQLYQGDYPCTPPDALLKGALTDPWPLFGEDQEELAGNQRSMNDAATGLLLASPVFYLTEGERTIRLSFDFTPSSFRDLTTYISRFAAASQKTELAAQHELFNRTFNIDFTTAEGWRLVEKYVVRITGDNTIEVLIGLGSNIPPLVEYQPGIHGPGLQTTLPVIRLLINNTAPHGGLSFFHGLQIERIHLQSQVRQFRQIRMQNSLGNLAADSAFQPFGPLPSVGSYFDIKNTNVFNRYTTSLAIRLEWMDLPKEPGGFATWYAGYDTGVTDDSFRVSIGALSNGDAHPSIPRQQSFALYARDPDESSGGLAAVTWLKDIDIQRLELTNTPLLAQEEKEPEGFFRNGAIRIELLSPPEAYGHALFPRLFPEIAMYNAKWWHRRRPLPNQPYTPRAKSVSIDYTLEHAEAFKDPYDTDGGLELIHQYPFGFKRIYPGNDLRSITFLPSIDPGGHVHIGLGNARHEEELSLLFQLEERNFHHTLHDTGVIVWSYLQDDEWVLMDTAAVLSDTTNGFINTGVIRLKLPARISLEHTTWPAGLFWIRATLSGAADMNSRVVAVLPQAAIAEKVQEGMSTSISLPPGSIANLLRKVQGIQQVFQPFPSFGGQPVEQDEAYYIRVSERCRHKKRPLTSVDIEQLVLERFPSIAVVKCFGTNNKRQSIYPGVDMQVILIPKVGANNIQHTDQPKVNLATLFAVKNYLAGFASPFINIEIGNPVYEKIKIACRIKLAVPLNSDARGSEGYYLKTLHDDIRRYLCPWIYSPGSEVKIGTRIYIPELLTFIRKRPYIAEVTGFSVVHFFFVKDPVTGELRGALIDSAVDAVEYIQGSVPEAVLIPSDHHLISLMTAGDYPEPAPTGISELVIGNELLVSRHGKAPHEGYDEAPASREDPDEIFDWTIVNATK